MNKKAFIRTMEVLLSTVIIITLLRFMSERAYTPTFELRPNPTYKANDILDLLYDSSVLEEYLKEYDIKSLDSHATYLLPVRTTHKIEADISTKISIEDISGATREKDEFGFTYNFPKNVDKNSIFMTAESELMDKNVLWVWYVTPVSFENNLTTNMLNENITLMNTDVQVPSTYGVLNDSLSFFLNNEELDLQVDNIKNISNGWFNLSANVTVKIPFLKSGDVAHGYLFYAFNSTTFNNTFNGRIVALTNKREDTYIKTLKLKAEASTRADVLLTTTLNASKKKELFATYSINTKKLNSYNSSMTLANKTNVTISLSENTVKGGEFPLYTKLPSARVYSSTKIIPVEENIGKVRLFVWFVN